MSPSEAVDGHPLVVAVEQGSKVDLGREPQGAEPEAGQSKLCKGPGIGEALHHRRHHADLGAGARRVTVHPELGFM